MSIATVWSDDRREGEYAFFTFREDSGLTGIELLGESAKHMKLIGKVYIVGSSSNQTPGSVYLSKTDVLNTLSKSGAKTEDIEKIEKEM